MAAEEIKRKLTAILSADVKAYSRLMVQDEDSTIQTLTAHRETISDVVEPHGGRIVDSPGDNILAAFESVSSAVKCAVEMQRQLAERNAETPAARMMQWRIGINLGDVVEKDNKIYGDGVNIAARVEKLAKPGGVCISGTVYDQVKGKLGLEYGSLGERRVKNMPERVRIYRVLTPSGAGGHRKGRLSRVAVRIHRHAASAAAIAILLCASLPVIWYYVLRTETPTQMVVAGEGDGSAVGSSQTPTGKAAIAVLPFVNMSGDPQQEYFSDGMTEDIITCLSRNSQLHVIARTSVFTYKGQPVKVKQVSRELGVGYVLEGSVGKSGSSVRVTAKLIDAKTEGHLWAETYERELQDIFDIQYEVAQQIAAALIVRYKEAEKVRARRIPTKNLTAYGLYWRGLAYSYKTREGNARRRELLSRAVGLDPQFAAALAHLGITYIQDYDSGWNRDLQILDQALELANKAIAIDPTVSVAHRLLAYVYLMRGKHVQAITAAQWAAALDPNDPAAYRLQGTVLINTGKPEEGIKLIREATALDPRNPVRDLYQLGIAYFAMGRFEEAVAAHQRLLSHDPGYIFAYFELSRYYLLQWINLQSWDPQVLDSALEMAQMASTLDDSSSINCTILSGIHLWRREHDKATANAKRLIELAPSDSVSYVTLASIHNYAGRPEEAIAMVDEAMRLGPPDPNACLLERGRAYRLLGRHEEAVEIQKHCVRDDPDSFESHYELAILYAELDRMAEAQSQVEEMLRLNGNFSVETWRQRAPYADPAQTDRDLASLRSAGLR